MPDGITKKQEHPKSHEWVWNTAIQDGRSDDEDLVRVSDEPCDIRCKHCGLIVPSEDYKRLTLLLRKDTHLTVEQLADRFEERLEFIALKYDLAKPETK